MIVPADSPTIPFDSATDAIRRVYGHELRIRTTSGNYAIYTAAGAIEELRNLQAILEKRADGYASSVLTIGWFLLQIKAGFPQGSWLVWLAKAGFHGKRAQEWMRIASEFANSDGGPDLQKLAEHGIHTDEHGLVLASYTKIRSVVREQRRQRREANGIKSPGRADDLDGVLLGDEENDDLTPEEEALAGPSVRFAPPAHGVVNAAATPISPILRDGLAASDMQGGSNRHTGIGVRAGIASEPTVVAGSGPMAGAGAANERSLSMSEGKDRGAAGAQISLGEYMESVRRDREVALAGIQQLVGRIERGDMSVEDGSLAMAMIRQTVERSLGV